MKIAILTQPLRTNFGGILQNYALQTVLRRMGHEPITIDYACRYTKTRWVIGSVKSIITGSKHNIQFPHYNRSGQENLNRFIHKHISITKPIEVLTKKIIDVINPDVVLVGSDQVWAPECNVPIEYLGHMYLDFVSDFRGRRVAYAASFGRSEWTYPREWEERCIKLVNDFDAVSVREESGVKLCKEHLGVDASHVLDPTLLLSAEDYEIILPRLRRRTRILFAYVLDTSDKKIEFLNKVADKFELQLKIQGANDDISWDDSIEDWLCDIRDAAMVVTDSFHGSVFAIQFKRPFFSILNHKRGADRFVSLLNKLGLSQNIISEDCDARFLTCNIDWELVERKLAEERCKSLEFLNSAL